jgi:RNA polymerase sigma-70 factor (ECF subfamily)
MATVPHDDQRARFESMYAEHRLRVLAYCLRRTRSEDASDVCAETFVVAWKRIDDIPPPPLTLPYLYGIARRVLSNHLRALRRRSRLDAKLFNLGVAPPSEPPVLVLQSSRDEEVLAAVNRLTPKDREIVMLFAWEELSRDDIAATMGMTRAAIDQRIHRSYQRLARTLEPSMKRPEISSSPIVKEGGA